uniref:Uncharacterized protein n=1 Tax=Lepeophtheirus salmonis TaxID=72036 RepID=A0A0K2UXN2_LEPSM
MPSLDVDVSVLIFKYGLNSLRIGEYESLKFDHHFR